MRLVASYALFSMLVAVGHSACDLKLGLSDGWTGEIAHKKSFVTELVESAFHGLDEHEYTPERLTQFVKERMDRCFPSENVSFFAPAQPVVYRITWNVQLLESLDTSDYGDFAAKQGLGRGNSLGFFLYTRKCYFWRLKGFSKEPFFAFNSI